MKVQIIHPAEHTEIKVIEDTQFIIIPTVENSILTLLFETPHVSAEVLGIYNLKANAVLSLETIATHKAPSTTCFTNVRAVLGDNAAFKYKGSIVIEKSAQQTTSFLHTNTLVVGEGISNVSEPILKIDANDVKASHGSTTGRISADQIYYLQSRGLDKTESSALIVEGFLESLMATIKDDAVKAEIKKTL